MKSTAIQPSHADPYARTAKPKVSIRAGQGAWGASLRDLWQARELLYFLVWRDIKVRYKQSVLGMLWIVIQPLVTMVVFTLLFNRLLGVQTGSDVPYPVYTFAALLPWTYFAGALSRGSLSLVNDRNLLTKVYFPRLVMPLAAVLPGLLDFAIAGVVLVGMMVFYGLSVSANLLLLPFFLIIAVAVALGGVLWLSALYVRYRDIQYVVPFVIQIWLYLTPVFYPVTRIPAEWRWLYTLNPMVGVVQSFRWVVLGEELESVFTFGSLAITLLLLLTGIVYFRQTERVFADVV